MITTRAGAESVFLRRLLGRSQAGWRLTKAALGDSASAEGQTGHLVRCGQAGRLQAANRTERQTDRHTRGGPETAQIPKMPTGYGPSDVR